MQAAIRRPACKRTGKDVLSTVNSWARTPSQFHTCSSYRYRSPAGLLSAKSTRTATTATTATTFHPNFWHQCQRQYLHCTKRHFSSSLPRKHAVTFQADSTIYALSTAPGAAAIAVIRISGPACQQIYQQLCPGRPLPKPRTAALRTLYEPFSGANPEHVIDSGALILFFPAPNTVTGEDLLELHVHGGPAVVKAVLAAIPRCGISDDDDFTRQSIIRYAEPGEFTRRAFMNDRLDLTQIEALGDTLAAVTEQQRRLSVRGTTSALSKRYDSWRQQLLYARGELEALIDFSEDQHFDESPSMLASSVAVQVEALKKQIEAHSVNAVRGELLRNGISISLLGAPNAGKSSLLNRIVGREAAIVSTEEGTTRDIVEAGVDIRGWFCRFGDTAGLRKGPGPGSSPDTLSAKSSPTLTLSGSTNVGKVELEGIRRAKERAMQSDIVIVVMSMEPRRGAADQGTGQGQGGFELRAEPDVVETAARLAEMHDNVIIVVNKVDLLADPGFTSTPTQSLVKDRVEHSVRDLFPSIPSERIFCISCKSAEATTTATPTENNHVSHDPQDPGGLQNFLNGLVAHFEKMTTAFVPDLPGQLVDSSVWEESLGATERQRLLLNDCATHLDRFLSEVGPSNDHNDIMGDEQADSLDIVVAAESLRAAADCLAKITGKGEAGDVEEVLGVVFEKFCVGK